MAEVPRVLVVEDDPTENQFLTMTVRGLGHAAESCLDGQAAIAWLQENKPALVFLDALLPKADGFAVLAEIKRLHPEAPVYMMSGVYKKKQYEQEAIGKLGATAYLHKPMAVLQVWEILEKCLPPATGLVATGDSPGVPFWRRPLPAVIADLWSGSKTGLLFVRGTGGSAILFFENGSLIFGRSNDPHLRIDRILVQLGRLKREQLPKVAEIAGMARGRLGEALVAEKLITAADLSEALALQQRNHVSRPMTWTEGSCWFLASDAPRHETFKMQLDVPAMVFWACRHLEVDEHLIRFLPKPDRKVRARQSGEELARPFGLSPDEAQFVDLADGTRTVGQLRAIGRMMQLDVERILAGLHALQLLDVAEPAEAPPDHATLFAASVPGYGDISLYTPPLLLVSLAFGGRTGILQLETPGAGGTVMRTVHFENGRIAFAMSSDPADRIGQVLLRVGLLTREQLHEALALAQSTPGSALGRVLVSQKMLAPDDIHVALMHQAQQVITGLVGWREGTFRFTENDGPGRDIVPLGLDTRQALMTALRTCPFADLAPRLPAPQTRLRETATAHQLAADLPLTTLEQRTRREADGSRTVREIAGNTPEGPEAALRAIYTLTTIGIIEGFLLAQGEEAPPPRPELKPVSLDAVLLPQLALSDDSMHGGETSGERRRRGAVIVADESFDVPADDGDVAVQGDETFGRPAPAAGFAEDWSSPEDASFADLAEDGASNREWKAPAAVAPPATKAETGDASSLPGSMIDEFEAGLPLDGGASWTDSPSFGGMGGTAVAAAPVTWTSTQKAAVADFLARLGQWSRICPEAVPESVRKALPPEIREAYGL